MNAEKFWKDVLQQNRDTLADWFRPETAVLWEPDRIRKRMQERLKGFAEDLNSAVTRGEAVPRQESLLQGHLYPILGAFFHDFPSFHINDRFHLYHSVNKSVYLAT